LFLNVLGKETLVTSKAEPWDSKDSGRTRVKEVMAIGFSVGENLASSERLVFGGVNC